MRHAPFRIGIAERDAWLRHMSAALDEIPAFTEAGVADRMREYFTGAAEFLRNVDE
jgi:hemoglobin